MAVEIADGFDTYTAAQIGRYYPGATADAMVTGYGGAGQALELQAGSVPMALTARAEYIFCLHWYSHYDQGGSSRPWFTVYNALGSAILTLAGGGIGGTTLWINGTPYTGALTGSYQALGVHLVASATVGVITVILDGVTIYAGTGLNTGASLIASVHLVGVNYYSNAGYFDHFAVFNTLGSHSNAMPTGRILVPPLYPNADGSYQGFTPNSGSTHYTRVNEAQPDDDTSYVSSAIAQADSYGIQSLPGSGIDQVHAVQVRAVFRKDDVNPKVLHVTLESGLVISETADIAPLTTYSAAALLLADDPNTASQWTAANVDAVQIGVKEIS